MKLSDPKPIHLKDYTVPPYLIESVDLEFDIELPDTKVRSRIHFKKNPKHTGKNQLPLNGAFFELQSMAVDEKPLDLNTLDIKDNVLTLTELPDEFQLETHTLLKPEENTALEGLYKSGQILCTQNEAEGFRRITYFPDRPDVMATYTTTIIANKKQFPYLLSNGNLVDSADLENGRHMCKWHDPHKKPCYLYALVAGDLGLVEDSFTTKSGRNVRLQLFVDRGDEYRGHHAMNSLKESMRWDEETYNLEYDLDIYMIVSVNSFNAGAMENKGLNIFNSKYVLADPETATDDEYEAIQGVIGHEYFHNWSGNRVTCRDWFQLSLKEGLTVYRDQEFTSDLTSRPVKRLNDVNLLRTHQFAEDAGPMAHPVRPGSYISVNNFYTLTVYEKGSEVVRMIHTIIGDKNFKEGLSLYFSRFDGQAVTTDDFVTCMEEISNIDLTQFRNWYDQAGTPSVSASWEYNKDSSELSLTLKQSCAPSPGQDSKKPYHIPVSIALFNSDGKRIPFTFEGDTQTNKVLHLKSETQTFKLEQVKGFHTTSLLRNFSAPINLKTQHTDDELCFLMANDDDAFCKWEASQQLALKTIKQNIESLKQSQNLVVNENYIKAFKAIINDQALDPAFKAKLLIIPDYLYISQFVDEIDPDLIFKSRDFLMESIVNAHFDDLLSLYNSLLDSNNSELTSEFSSQRTLRNEVLDLLGYKKSEDIHKLAFDQYNNAKNMTDRLGALSYLNDVGSDLRKSAMEDYYKRFESDTLTMDKWFTLIATSKLPNVLDEIKRVQEDKTFDIKVPNKCYSLFFRFGRANPLRFHDKTGEAYKFFADTIIRVDKLNPQVASRLTSVFNHWKKFEPTRKALMKEQLQRIVDEEGLSSNVFEIASKALK